MDFTDPGELSFAPPSVQSFATKGRRVNIDALSSSPPLIHRRFTISRNQDLSSFSRMFPYLCVRLLHQHLLKRLCNYLVALSRFFEPRISFMQHVYSISHVFGKLLPYSCFFANFPSFFGIFSRKNASSFLFRLKEPIIIDEMAKS